MGRERGGRSGLREKELSEKSSRRKTNASIDVPSPPSLFLSPVLPLSPRLKLSLSLSLSLILTCRNAGTSSYLSLTVGIGAVSLAGSAERKALRSKLGSRASLIVLAFAAAAAAAASPPPPPLPPFIAEGPGSSARDLGRGGAIALEARRELGERERERARGRAKKCSRRRFPSALKFFFAEVFELFGLSLFLFPLFFSLFRA